MSDAQWARMLDFWRGIDNHVHLPSSSAREDSPISGSEFKLREGRVRRPPSKFHHDIAQNRRHPARVDLSWRLAPYYQLFNPDDMPAEASIALRINQFLRRIRMDDTRTFLVIFSPSTPLESTLRVRLLILFRGRLDQAVF